MTVVRMQKRLPSGNSKVVVSNQAGIHPELAKVLQKHRQHAFKKPHSRHTEQAFRAAQDIISKNNLPLIFDSGCGTGESTLLLARQHPGHLVLGIDKSAARLGRREQPGAPQLENCLFLRADYYDFWRLAAAAGWKAAKHLLFYPNPWPKKQHLRRRIHGHPAFFDLLKLGGEIDIRSNWKVYLDEFAAACRSTCGMLLEVQAYTPHTAISAFERKYHQSGHLLFRLKLRSCESVGRNGRV